MIVILLLLRVWYFRPCDSNSITCPGARGASSPRVIHSAPRSLSMPLSYDTHASEMGVQGRKVGHRLVVIRRTPGIVYLALGRRNGHDPEDVHAFLGGIPLDDDLVTGVHHGAAPSPLLKGQGT